MKMSKLKQFLCPLKPTVYLVGGLEFGHDWRRIEGLSDVICRKCGKQMWIGSYSYDSKEAQELRDKFNTNK